MIKYRTSGHGKALLGKGDSAAAQCVSCHAGHGVRRAESPLSRVNPKNVPETCGVCHADPAVMKGRSRKARTPPMPYKKSVHGNALLEKGDLGAPACNDCHGNHAALPPMTSHISQMCRNCHVEQGTLFDSSLHKKAFEKHSWPECAQCHNNHLVRKPTDRMLGPTGLCVYCHN
ncbi:cytochrome c3 family protein, partial [Acidobacteriota bacterium]